MQPVPSAGKLMQPVPSAGKTDATGAKGGKPVGGNKREKSYHYHVTGAV